MIVRILVELVMLGAAFVWGAWYQRFDGLKHKNLVLQIPKEMMPPAGQPLQIQFVGNPVPNVVSQ